jgi:hypothetical protein
MRNMDIYIPEGERSYSQEASSNPFGQLMKVSWPEGEL